MAIFTPFRCLVRDGDAFGRGLQVEQRAATRRARDELGLRDAHAGGLQDAEEQARAGVVVERGALRPTLSPRPSHNSEPRTVELRNRTSRSSPSTCSCRWMGRSPELRPACGRRARRRTTGTDRGERRSSSDGAGGEPVLGRVDDGDRRVTTERRCHRGRRARTDAAHSCRGRRRSAHR